MVRFHKRYAHGLSVGGNYTYSKFLANVSDPGTNLGDDSGPYSNLYNRHADYGYEQNDIRHHFTFNAVYELPFGPGRHWLDAGMAGKVPRGLAFFEAGQLPKGAPVTGVIETEHN